MELSSKKSLLVIGKILGLIFNTSAACQKYFVLDKDNLLQPIQKQSSLKRNTFSQIFSAFLKCR